MRTDLRRTVLTSLFTILALLLAACTPPPPADGGGDDEGPPALDGVWQPVGGDDALEVPSADARFLVLGGSSGVSGPGVLHARVGADIPACLPLIFSAISDDTVALYSDAIGFRGLGTAFFGAGVELFLYERPDADTLVLEDEQGNRQTFTRAAAVPAADACTAAAATREAEGIELDLANAGNLLSDGSDLRVVGEDGFVYPIDLTGGGLGAGSDLNNGYDQVVTMQDGTYWGHCGCGGSEDIRRIQLGGAELDDFDTETDLGQDIGIRAGTWDGLSLWLGGRSDDGVYRLLQIDSEAEPDVLVRTVELDVFPRAIAFLDGELWVLLNALGPKLAVVDPADGSLSNVLDLPEPSDFGFYDGLTALDGSLYLLVDQDGNRFDIYSVTP